MPDPHAGPRRWVFAAALFFAAVIAWFLWARWSDGLWSRGAAAARPPAAPRPAPPPGGDVGLPTARVFMRVDRVEPRKYRREDGAIPPPAGKPR